MQHHLRRCGGGALAALRRARHFPAAASTVSAAPPPAAWWRPSTSSRLYSTADISQQLPANLVQIMEQRMKLIEQRSAYLQEQINQPAASPEEYSRANKEFHKLESTMGLIKELRSKQKEIEGLKSLVTNSIEEKDMREMAAEELLEAVEEEKRLQHALFKSLLPKDEADERDCILEVRAGTGGEEASLFAMDIFKMYEKYSQKNGWKFDALDIMESVLKGYKEASGTISGPGAYGKLKFESGIHRVQVLQNRGYDGSLSDIWSCGVILYIMLIGYLPFDDRNLVVLYQKIFKGDTQIPKWLSPSAQNLLQRILEPNPAKRISMSEIKAHEWFQKDYIPVAPYDDNDEDVQLGAVPPVKEEINEAPGDKSTYQMNAFQLIGMASSLDLSGLFEEEEVSQRKIRFTSSQPPMDLFDKIESSATELGFQVQRVHSKLKVMHNCNGLKNPASFLVCTEVFELGPSLYVVELKKSHGDLALYRQLCDRISTDLGIGKIFRTESLDDDLPSFDSRAATPLVAL